MGKAAENREYRENGDVNPGPCGRLRRVTWKVRNAAVAVRNTVSVRKNESTSMTTGR